MELEGKRALITGAGRGLGLAIAALFIERGARVALADLDDAAAESAAAGLGAGAIALHCDVTKPDDVQRAIAGAVAAFDGLDVMVNNAGIEIGKPIPETSDEEFATLMAINVNGVFYGIKYAIGALAQTRGCIINMSSVAGLDGVPLLGAYCASKAAVIRLTQTAAIELRDAGIRVNAICPAFIDTQMVERLVAPFEAATGANFDDLAAQAQGRLGTPEEVAEMVAFLASDDARWITGSYYILDNGLTASVL
ncbi:MAG: SDR family NAD(P)-dependent oxidoreductase [Solirubrobacteraceae bacterium]|jgi:NAD(P)-dependent dehydrogenase (short-subunit alcohol dehydrogenase family)